MRTGTTDRRIKRTREALLGAFVQLMLEGRRYDRIRVADLIERAGVGRSTFYEHYRSKEEILAETIRAPFAMLAGAVARDFDPAALRRVLAHFRENRLHARAVLVGAVGRRVARVLSSMIEEQLRERARGNGVASSADVAIAARMIAEGQIAAISAWLAGAGDERILAQTMHRVAQAVAGEVCGR